MNFVSGGKLGDFIHEMYVVKNICKQRGVHANVYIADGMGDVWGKGLEIAYRDLRVLISIQSYIEEFKILDRSVDGDFIDLNKWRVSVADTYGRTGKYDTSWSDLLSKEYGFVHG